MDKLRDNKFKSGFVSLIGRPNAGKSTLINTIIGQKIAITSNVVQTTRHRINGIYNSKDTQIVFVDTPGLHKPKDVLGQELNASVFQSIHDIDILTVLFDANTKIGAGDKWIINNLDKYNCPKICVLSKCDLIDSNEKINKIKIIDSYYNWNSIVCLSSKNNYNINAFIEEIEKFLPYGPKWYSQDEISDQPLSTLCAEYIREQVIKSVYEEIPHSIGVQINDYFFDKSKNIYYFYADVFVEKESQKGIVIGKSGANIKKIGSLAREELENLLSTKVFLDIEVKVKKNWRRNYNLVRKFGYTYE